MQPKQAPSAEIDHAMTPSNPHPEANRTSNEIKYLSTHPRAVARSAYRHLLHQKQGDPDIDVEGGRNLQQLGDSQWVVGVILAHRFSPGFQMMFEAREHWSSAGAATLLSVGGHVELGGGLALLAAAGREAGAAEPGRLSTLAYLGIQIRR
jgi:hypothetical protein